jgi:hypothetical protein
VTLELLKPDFPGSNADQEYRFRNRNPIFQEILEHCNLDKPKLEI